MSCPPKKPFNEQGICGRSKVFFGEGSKVDANLALHGSTAYTLIILCCQEGVAGDGDTSGFLHRTSTAILNKSVKGVKENSFWGKIIES